MEKSAYDALSDDAKALYDWASEEISNLKHQLALHTAAHTHDVKKVIAAYLRDKGDSV